MLFAVSTRQTGGFSELILINIRAWTNDKFISIQQYSFVYRLILATKRIKHLQTLAIVQSLLD